MTPAQAVTASAATSPRVTPLGSTGIELVTGDGIVSVDVTFLVREALGRGVQQLSLEPSSSDAEPRHHAGTSTPDAPTD
ncbi:hypothetical protein ET475_06585 [Microbacterium protaetiae]|uniref:Uncharacterized protein n=1 Tax=Microbacterium protaetiae TaxID=2509458 RepID=A0A4P6EBV0_9MICO|nr:hypothetical protein [Microbacterium protaetiae]QAY59692.1 hypothetical protein ET475_06585 [Microbacterium protaetiae]